MKTCQVCSRSSPLAFSRRCAGNLPLDDESAGGGFSGAIIPMLDEIAAELGLAP